MTDKTIDLDQHRGMAAQKATDLRRLLADVEANEKALRLGRDELENHLLAAPAANWAPSSASDTCVLASATAVRAARVGGDFGRVSGSPDLHGQWHADQASRHPASHVTGCPVRAR